MTRPFTPLEKKNTQLSCLLQRNLVDCLQLSFGTTLILDFEKPSVFLPSSCYVHMQYDCFLITKIIDSKASVHEDAATEVSTRHLLLDSNMQAKNVNHLS